MFWIVIFSMVLSFFTVWSLTAPMKKFLERVGILGIDQQKPEKPRIATSGGVLVISGVLLSGFLFIGVNTFFLNKTTNLSYLLAAYNSILIITMVGFLDDINMRASPIKNKGLNSHRIGLKQWQKPLLTLPAAIPLMAVRAGDTTMSLPFLGDVEFGIFYPLILIPLAVVFVSNATNMLAGMNGLEAGLGFTSILTLGVYAFSIGSTEAAIIALTASFGLLAFLKYNWYPAKFLPGDSLTYLIGACFVSVVIIGNMERFGIIIFMPWIIEFFLKLRSKFKARSLGNLQKDGTLSAPYKNIYSLTHLVMKGGRLKEYQITSLLLIIEIAICIAALAFSL